MNEILIIIFFISLKLVIEIEWVRSELWLKHKGALSVMKWSLFCVSLILNDHKDLKHAKNPTRNGIIVVILKHWNNVNGSWRWRSDATGKTHEKQWRQRMTVKNDKSQWMNTILWTILHCFQLTFNHWFWRAGHPFHNMEHLHNNN